MRRAWMVTLAATSAALLALAPATAAGRTRRPAPLTPGQSTAALGLDLLRRLGTGNLVVSPDSIETAVAMAGAGAAGRTAAQMAHVLHLPSPAAFASVGQLQAKIAAEQSAARNGDPGAPQLSVADGLFLQQGFPAAAPFLASLTQNFAAAPQTVDFRGDPGAAVQRINEWVSSNTGGLIPSMLSKVEENARLILANAIYLHAYWAEQFSRGSVRPGTFHSPGRSAQVALMHQTEKLAFGEGKGYMAVELPYRSSTLSLMLMLPAGQSLRALQRGLSAVSLSRVAARMRPAEVELAMPKFHLTLRTELATTLSSLGMPLAFTAAADFSGIDRAEHLTISRIAHAADIEVQEEGTVAAAATVVEVIGSSVERHPQLKVFDANRPFLFLLRDDRTGAVLFAGRLVNAAEAQI